MLMFQEVPDEFGTPAKLVKAADLGYDQKPIVTYLSTLGLGYGWDANSNISTAHTPTLVLDYTRVGALSTVVWIVDEPLLRQAPGGIDGRNYHLVDPTQRASPAFWRARRDPRPAPTTSATWAARVLPRPNRVAQARNEIHGAVVLTTYDYETMFLADMSGDGLSDLTCIRNADTCYWPNLGSGRFGGKITMQSAPLFDTPDRFYLRRVRLGDIHGTGATDIVYLSRQGANNVANGLGARSAITYAPSAQFYLEDRLAGQPRATRLPFVVQMVAQLTVDAIALRTSQLGDRYVHGFYGRSEREFHGFARVDTWDGEAMSSDHGAGPPPGSIDEVGGEYDPPHRACEWARESV
jgi:hypothetical protein